MKIAEPDEEVLMKEKDLDISPSFLDPLRFKILTKPLIMGFTYHFPLMSPCCHFTRKEKFFSYLKS